MKTKDKIIYESLKLFAQKGFDAVSVRAIANEVGIENSGLYKHFSSKQAILDEIIRVCKKRFIYQCAKIQNEITETITDLKEMTLGIFEFQITDEWIVAFRQIVMLEQYKNPAMASLYKSCFIDLPLQAQKNIFNQLIEKKVLTYEDDIEIMALELYAPFFLYYSVSLSLDDIKPILQRHVDTFFEKYF
ncbi:MAG: TetR/AcrR family transcriptional regulator [Spirochaetaceae bacterium]|nr:TetR/AcrR family transcriptional regulator [Spirochaetaceae bacterium]